MGAQFATNLPSPSKDTFRIPRDGIFTVRVQGLAISVWNGFTRLWVSWAARRCGNLQRQNQSHVHQEEGNGNGSAQAVLLLSTMSSISKYAAVTTAFVLATCGVSAFGFAVAADLFTPAAQNGNAEVALAAQDGSVSRGVKHPVSMLLGAKPAAVAAEDGEAAGEDRWVEVARAVNMRQGPSSASAVIKVQRAGTKLRVASHEGKWVQVVEPDTGGMGWVFETFVKSVSSGGRHADATETAMR